VAKINWQVHTVLPVWDSANPLWAKPVVARTAFHVGWIGSAAEREDLLTIKMDLTRFMRVCPRAVLVIAGDGGAFEAMGRISEQRRIFLPDVGATEIPYVLSQLDVLLVPWRDVPYNRSKSDLPLVEAGVRGLPWVASPIPSYREWGVGGILAEKPGACFQALTRLVNEPDLCQTLGAAGNQKAAERAI
jgi:glycosyltransferase involved in cell wall biosynthesis